MTARTRLAARDRLPRPGFAAGLTLILLAAGALRLARLADLPPGLPGAAAEHGLLARAMVEGGIAGAMREPGTASVPLAAIVALAGRLTGFDATTPALGAALAGTVAVGGTALWLRRALGPAWGLAGGVLLAGSFWPLLFGRLGLSPVVGAAALAALLWLLREAIGRPLRVALGWYTLAGLAAAVGFAADPALRIMPGLLLVGLGAALWQARAGGSSSRDAAWGLGVTLLTAVLAALPWVVAQGAVPGQLGPSTPTPGLPGATAADLAGAAYGYGVSLARLVWPGTGDAGLHLPGAPLFEPWLAPWALLGGGVALRRARQPRAAVGLAWGALLLLPAALVDPGHPGRLVPALPLLVLLPLLGMRAAVARAGQGRARLAVGALVVATLAGTVSVGPWRYFQGWATDPATAAALDAGVVASLEALRQLPPDEPVVYSTAAEHAAVVRYLAHDVAPLEVDGRHLLLLPGDPMRGVRRGWLVIPAATPLNPHLLELFAGIPPVAVGRDAGGAEAYRVYRIDERVGQRIPLSVPTIAWADGAVFQGFRLTPLADGRAAVVLAWALPAGSGPRVAVVQLTGDARSEARLALPPTAPGQPVIAVGSVTLDIPATTGPLGLRLGLLDGDNRPIAVPGADADGLLLLERYRFER